MSSVDPNAQTAKDIESARKRSKLDVPAVRAYLHGDEDSWQAHRLVEEVFSADSTFSKSRRHFLTRSDVYRRALEMQKRIQELKEAHKWGPKELSFVQMALDTEMPLNLHDAAFEPIFMAQASPELLEKYGRLVRHKGVIGCYLQTELGHGSNVAQLETTATYFPQTEEFEIHSPTFTSTKWWIGSAGKTATHGVIQAQLRLPDGKDVGPHLFFIQLRSLDNHKVLPGIELGDIGPKAMSGYAGIDNGYARFSHVRIPRWHMLSKFSQVTKDGQYIKPPHAKVSYGGMLYIRSTMVTSTGRILAKAATISIRYATVRRQGNKQPDGLERQIITYPSVHHRLLPILSRAYVYILLGRDLLNSYSEMSQRLARNDTSLLAGMHAITSGLKVLVTTTSVEDVEVARRSMGGHGFSAFAGLGLVYASHLPSVTYEGDNFVLNQQVVRAALKSYRTFVGSGASPDEDPSAYNAYLRHLRSGAMTPDASSPSTWTDRHKLVHVLEWRAARAVEAYASLSSNGEIDASADQRVSRAVTEAFVAGQVLKFMDTLSFGGPTKSIVSDLLRLYLLATIETSLTDLLSFGLRISLPVSKDPTTPLRMEIARLCLRLVPDSVALTDAFGFTDWELDSALGVHDGRVYDALWAKAQTEPLNETEVPDGYKEYIKPLLERGRQLAQQEPKTKL